jgi:hypothetical protein
MGKLYLAANYITNSEPGILVPQDLENAGDLQIVHEDDAGQFTEIEVQAPLPEFGALGGNWSFERRNHGDGTEYVENNGQITNTDRYPNIEQT